MTIRTLRPFCESYSRSRDSSLAPVSPFERFSRPHEKRNEASRFFQSLTTRGTSGNAEEDDDDVEAVREMVKKGGEEEEDEEVRLAGGPTAVNRDGSNGKLAACLKRPLTSVKIYSPLQQDKPLIRDFRLESIYMQNESAT